MALATCAGQSFRVIPFLISLPIKVAQRHNALLSFWWRLSCKKRTPLLFGTKRWNQFCEIFSKRVSLQVHKKHRRLCKKSKRIDWYLSWPHFFWLDSIENMLKGQKDWNILANNRKNFFLSSHPTLEGLIKPKNHLTLLSLKVMIWSLANLGLISLDGYLLIFPVYSLRVLIVWLTSVSK